MFSNIPAFVLSRNWLWSALNWSLFGWAFLVTPVALSQVDALDWLHRADQESDPQKAEAYYAEALRLRPDAADAYVGRAVVRSKMEHYADALDDLNQAIRLDPKPAKFYAQRAYVYAQLSDYQRAADDYQRAIERAPGVATHYSGLSYCLTKHGRFEEAEAKAQQGIAIDPKSPYPYRNRGRARLRRGNVNAAINDFNTSLRLKHNQPYRVYCDLGEAHEKKGKNQEALNFYKQALTLKPDYAEAVVGKSQLEQKMRLGNLLPASTFTGKRVALVIGNSDYSPRVGKLSDQPVNDARVMRNRLEELNFDVKECFNAGEESLRRALDEFAALAKESDVALLFYAGHGFQYKGENYLLPTDVPLLDQPTENEQVKRTVSLTGVLDQLQKQQPNFCILIVDACRNDLAKPPDSTSGNLLNADVPTPDSSAKPALPRRSSWPLPRLM